MDWGLVNEKEFCRLILIESPESAIGEIGAAVVKTLKGRAKAKKKGGSQEVEEHPDIRVFCYGFIYNKTGHICQCGCR